jgi:hypothetical protein
MEGGYKSVHTGVHESTPQCGREAAGTVSERDDYTRSHACEFMIRVTDTRWSGLDPTLLSVLVANGVPVAGLLAFDVSAAALLAFYWLEFGVVSVWATVRATFAGERPEAEHDRSAFSSRRWTTLRVIYGWLSREDERDETSASGRSWRARRIRIPRTDVGVYLGTIPALVVIVPMLAVVWLGYGAVVAGPVVAATNATDTPTWVLTGTGVVFVSEGGQTLITYFLRGGYRDTSAWGAVTGIFWQGFLLAGVGVFVLLVAYEFADGRAVSIEGAASGPLVFFAVTCKLLIDLARYYRGRSA